MIKIITTEKEFIEAVKEGIADADAGRVTPYEVVMAEIEEKIRRRLEEYNLSNASSATTGN